MDTMTYLVVILLAVTTPCLSLQCYKCTYSTLDTDNTVLQFFTQALKYLSDESCKLETEDQKTKVDIRQCPAPSSQGKVMKCFDVTGKIRTSFNLLVGSIAFNIDTITRDCIEVDRNDQTTSDGCHNDLPSTAQNYFKHVYENTIKLGDMTLNGEICYHTGTLTNTAERNKFMWLYSGVTVAFVMMVQKWLLD